MICPLLSRVEGLDELGSLQPDPSAGVPWIQGRFKVAAISWLRFTALKCSGRIQSTGSNVSIQSGWSSEFGRRPVDDQGQGLCYRLIPFVIRLILLWSGGAVGRFSRSSFFFIISYYLSIYYLFISPCIYPSRLHFCLIFFLSIWNYPLILATLSVSSFRATGSATLDVEPSPRPLAAQPNPEIHLRFCDGWRESLATWRWNRELESARVTQPGRGRELRKPDEALTFLLTAVFHFNSQRNRHEMPQLII